MIPTLIAYEFLDNDAMRIARQALGDGLSREEVARELEQIANAIRYPAEVAEDTSPIVREA